MLGLLLAVPSAFVYPALFLVVGGESAGVPLPGETSLVTAGILASQGKLSLPLVVATAAAAAIVGDNLGYLFGRRGGRWLLTRSGRWSSARARLLARGEAFFERSRGTRRLLRTLAPRAPDSSRLARGNEPDAVAKLRDLERARRGLLGGLRGPRRLPSRSTRIDRVSLPRLWRRRPRRRDDSVAAQMASCPRMDRIAKGPQAANSEGKPCAPRLRRLVEAPAVAWG
jgi:membrane protein YqaA with SNARE-associated domain